MSVNMNHSNSLPLLQVTKVNVNDQSNVKRVMARRRSSVQRNLEKLQKRFQQLNAISTPDRTNKITDSKVYRRRLSTAIMERTTYVAKDSFTLKNNNNFAHNTTDFPLNVSISFIAYRFQA